MIKYFQLMDQPMDEFILREIEEVSISIILRANNFRVCRMPRRKSVRLKKTRNRLLLVMRLRVAAMLTPVLLV